MNQRIMLVTCTILLCLVVAGAAAAAPFMIYSEYRYGGGAGAPYYISIDEYGKAIAGNFGYGAQEWGDEVKMGLRCSNSRPPVLTPGMTAATNGTDFWPTAAYTDGNAYKAAFKLGGYIYGSNAWTSGLGGGWFSRQLTWDSTAAPEKMLWPEGTPPTGDSPDGACTDGTDIYCVCASGSSNSQKNMYGFTVSGTTLIRKWKTAMPNRCRGISYDKQSGNLYAVNNTTKDIYEINPATGAYTTICTSAAAGASPYSAMRFGDQIFTGCTGGYSVTTKTGGVWGAGVFVPLPGITSAWAVAPMGATPTSTVAKYAWIADSIGAMTFWDLDPASTPISIGEARKGTLKNGYPIAVQDVVVTKVGTDGFWAEDQNRAAGAHVIWAGAQPAVGAKVSFIGGLSTTDSGEKQLTPNAAPTSNGTFEVEPVFVTNKCTGPGTGAAGLANDGMLVRVTGVFKSYDNANTVYIDDGSGVANDLAGGPLGLKVFIADPASVPHFDEYIMWGAVPCNFTVTGIVRLEKLGDGTIIRRIDARSDADVLLVPLP